MKNKSNGSTGSRTHPPPHLPVLTEVVQLHDETVPGALTVLVEEALLAPEPQPSQPASPEAEPPHHPPAATADRPVPQWLLKKTGAVAPPAGAAVGAQPAPAAEVPRTAQAAPVAAPATPEPAIDPPDHVIPDTVPGFSSSWWMDDQEPAEPVAAVPSPKAPSPPSARGAQLVAASTPAPVSASVPPPFDEDALVRRVLADLERQVGMMFEHRMHEAVVPAFARATDALLAELRQQLALNLRDMVARAVALELARHSGGT